MTTLAQTTAAQTVLAQTPSADVAVQSVWDFVEKGGVMMYPLAACSLLAIAVAAERLVVLRRARVVPTGVGRRCDEAVEAGRDAQAFRSAEPSPAGRVLAAGMEKLPLGVEAVERNLAAEGEHEIHVLQRRLRALVVITALAPLLGLTGTIFGMIRAFQTVALSADALGKAELLATGIYEAMITTAAGLLVAMPTLILYHYLAGRVENLGHELNRLAVRFVNEHAIGKPSRPVAVPDVAAAATTNSVG